MKTALELLLITLMLAACTERKGGTILPEGTEIRPGDIVFRRGSGVTSHAVMMADRGGRYSHVGIAVDSAGTVMIVHAVPGEPDYKGDPDRVKMETPEKFFDVTNAVIGEIMRFKGDTAKARNAARHAVEIYRRKTLFDHDYDDNDTTKMYCCELVEYVYKGEGTDLAGKKRHEVNLPGMKIKCILPSDIARSKRLRSIAKF